MLGRLNFDALPFYSWIAFSGAAVTVLAGVAVIGILFYFRLWGWLWRNCLTTVDHKMLGIMYIVLAIVMLVRGFADAFMMRSQQALSVVGHGYLEGDHFQQVFSAHGTIMILFMAMPFMTGLANFVMPLQIGARDVSFPFLNALSFWLTTAGAGLVLISLVLGKFSAGGWTGYPPFTGIERSPDTGVDYWIWALLISGVGTTLTGVNLIVTILRRRAPGMKLMDMPIFTWTVLCTCVIILFAFPPLTVALALLEIDRIFGAHFFTATAGGNYMNFANLFWMWGHPEVYIVILPAFGVFSEVVATFSGKRIYGYEAMVKATAVIMVVSMLVWLHHFFTMGSSANVNAAFGIATMIIGIPTGVKVFHWMFTMYKGRVRMHSTMYWTIGFMVLFVIGGATGVIHATVPVDFNLHNTTFLVAHFHNMLIPGALFAFVAGYVFWFPKAFGFRLDEVWGRRAFWGWCIGFVLAFTPLYILGLMGMPRRIAEIYDKGFTTLLMIAMIGALSVAFGIFSIIMQLIVSIRNREALKDTTGDPWDGRTLEWSISSPPPPFNFARQPIISGRDVLAAAKESGKPIPLGPAEAIEMPKPNPNGFFIGVMSFVLGFAAVWWIWWLAVLSFLIIVALAIHQSFEDHGEYEIPLSDVNAIMAGQK
ncbi:MAG: cbb3-type cytochrome c oxidase subunit I [Proteobacteria bacterium]|nr:cbb3-type cytochrome c oxidase subunit I [Pseudomonadota bacterium]